MITFDRFFAEVHPGRRPYPWQQALAERLAGEPNGPGTASPPPLTVGVPTGSGKTSVIDALVWALAMQADRLPLQRTVGVRIVWAIDRRLLVDEVHAQAQDLADRLLDALLVPEHPLHELAVRLERLKGAFPSEDDATGSIRGAPLVATRWRGGVAIPSPGQHPLQAEIITSTVAQIGSRLLFRGYGLGHGSLPVAAALAACDTTICLDEAHLAAPFAETVDAIGRRRTATGDTAAPATRLIQLSATLPAPDTNGRSSTSAASSARIDLTDADLPVLGTRLDGPKWARLVEPTGTADKDHETALLAAIEEHVAAGRQTVACVVNSVRMARTVFDRVRKAHARPAADVILLIGPQRPADRDRVLHDSMPGDAAPSRYDVLFAAARPTCPLIVVATQTFEVGLDADVEALVTQSASAPALAQRLGRLNRSGTGTGHATIVRDTGSPLYEQDEDAAWQWLRALPARDDGTHDVSVSTLRESPAPLPLRCSRAPELTDATVLALTHTGSRPQAMADPDIDVFLRGVDSDPSSDVTICWRADLCEQDDSPGAATYREALLRLAPPRPEEQLSLSIGAARNLLRVRAGQLHVSPATQRRLTEDAADIEGSAQPLATGDGGGDHNHTFDEIPFFVRRGTDLLPGRRKDDPNRDAMTVWGIRPGDLLVLPTALGGIDDFGLAVTSPVGTDVAADVRATDPGPTPVRLTRGALDAALVGSIPLAGPRAQRVQRILRRAAAIESRVERSRRPGRVQALADLLRELDDHPAAAGLQPDGVELRRLTPTIPPEWTDPVDDVAGLFLGRPTAGSDSGLFFGEGDDDLGEPDSTASSSAVLLEGEDAPMATGGWVLVPLRGSSHGRLRPRDEDPPTLAEHAQAVAERAEQFARAADLPDDVVRTIVLAARVHDHGKADPRMQAFFRGGVAPPLAAPIAKSVFGTDDRRADRTARQASGMPRRLRHEQSSAAILAHALEYGRVTGLPDVPGRGISSELSLHETDAHHGHSRPWQPVPHGGAPSRSFAVDVAGVAGTARGDGREAWDLGASLRRFHALSERYGPWTLVYLEAMLVLADRTVSAEGR